MEWEEKSSKRWDRDAGIFNSIPQSPDSIHQPIPLILGNSPFTRSSCGKSLFAQKALHENGDRLKRGQVKSDIISVWSFWTTTLHPSFPYRCHLWLTKLHRQTDYHIPAGQSSWRHQSPYPYSFNFVQKAAENLNEKAERVTNKNVGKKNFLQKFLSLRVSVGKFFARLSTTLIFRYVYRFTCQLAQPRSFLYTATHQRWLGHKLNRRCRPDVTTLVLLLFIGTVLIIIVISKYSFSIMTRIFNCISNS